MYLQLMSLPNAFLGQPELIVAAQSIYSNITIIYIVQIKPTIASYSFLSRRQQCVPFISFTTTCLNTIYTTLLEPHTIPLIYYLLQHLTAKLVCPFPLSCHRSLLLLSFVQHLLRACSRLLTRVKAQAPPPLPPSP